MTPHFAAMPGGAAVLRLPPVEAELLRAVCAEYATLLDDPESAGPEVARRMQTAAYPDDPLAEDDFRAGPALSIDAARREAHAVVVAGLEINRRDDGAVVATIAAEDADAWLMALNNLRLVLATRLGVEADTDFDAMADAAYAEGDERLVLTIGVFEFLGLLMSELIDVLPDPVTHDDA